VTAIRARCAGRFDKIQAGMNSKIANWMVRWSRPTLIVSTIYSVLCSAAMMLGWGGEATRDFIAAWGSFPVSVMIAGPAVAGDHDRAIAPAAPLAWRSPSPRSFSISSRASPGVTWR
jgi:hypothetical protein